MLIRVRHCLCSQCDHGAIRWRAFVASVANVGVIAVNAVRRMIPAGAAKRLAALANAPLALVLDPDEQLRARDAATLVALLRSIYSPIYVYMTPGRKVIVDTLTSVALQANASFPSGFVFAGMIGAISANGNEELAPLLFALATGLKKDFDESGETHARVIADMQADDFQATAELWMRRGGMSMAAMLALGQYVVLGCLKHQNSVGAAQALAPMASVMVRVIAAHEEDETFTVLSTMWRRDLAPDHLASLLHSLAASTVLIMATSTKDVLAGKKAFSTCWKFQQDALTDEIARRNVAGLEKVLRSALPLATQGGHRLHVNTIAIAALQIAALTSLAVPPSLLTIIYKARLHVASIVTALTSWSHADTREAARLLLVRRPFTATDVSAADDADAATRAMLTDLDADAGVRDAGVGIRAQLIALDTDDGAVVPLCLSASPDVTEREARLRWSAAWERAFAALPLECRASRIAVTSSACCSPGVKFAAVCWNADCPLLDDHAAVEGGHMGLCGGCLKACYCSVACQRAGWRGGHRRVCSTLDL
jgi:hypothetical protein